MAKMYLLYKLFELNKFSEKTSEEKYAANLGTKAKQIFSKYLDYFKKYVKAQRFNFTYRGAVNVLLRVLQK